MRQDSANRPALALNLLRICFYSDPKLRPPIYTRGIPARKVLACTLCHGARAQGHDDTPRLAGQHAGYLKRQMSLFGLNWRQNALMHDNTQELTGAQIDALVSYLAND